MDQDIDIRGFQWDELETFTRMFNSINGVEGTVMESDVDLMRQTYSRSPRYRPRKTCDLLTSVPTWLDSTGCSGRSLLRG